MSTFVIYLLPKRLLTVEALMQGSLEHRSLVTQLADGLRTALVTGAMTVGADLSETQLAQQFDVSRATVREALRVLTVEGYVEKEPRKPWRVRRMPDETLWQVATVRGILEGFAAYVVTQLITAESERLLRRSISDMEQAAEREDYESFCQADLLFHQTLVELADNQILRECWFTTYAYSVLMLGGCKESFKSLDEILAEHRRVLDTILAGDPRSAQETTMTQIFEAYRSPKYDNRPVPWEHARTSP